LATVKRRIVTAEKTVRAFVQIEEISHG
jgi:hypothetical protein